MSTPRNYTERELEKMTAKQVKKVAVEAGCTGIYKMSKDDAIEYFINWQEERADELEAIGDLHDPLTGVAGRFKSTVVNPDGAPGTRVSTTVQVSCGANAGPFEVIGRSIAEVSDLLREVLNIESTATPLVNGRAVSNSYVLKVGDNLEYMKPAGRKGC
jgi:hypothetical protein